MVGRRRRPARKLRAMVLGFTVALRLLATLDDVIE
jgi:hypothetical protein